MYYGISKNKVLYVILAYIIHALIDGIVSFITLSYNAYIAEVALILMSTILFLFTIWLYKKERVDIITEPEFN